MKSVCAVISLGVFLVLGCAPSPTVELSFPKQAWRAPGDPLEIVAGVKDFTVQEGIPEKFSTHFSFGELAFGKPLADQVTEAFRKRLRESNIFERVVDFADDDRDVDLVISGHIRKSRWRETGSFWNLFWLSALTFDLYPLFGGPLAWPEAEAKLVVTLSKPSGKRIRIYSGRGQNSESLSMYGLSRVTPAVQLGSAIGDAIEEIEKKIYEDGEMIMYFAKPPPPPKLKPPAKPVEKPEITFLFPRDGSETEYAKVNIKASVTGEVPLANYRIYINGVQIYSGSLEEISAESAVSAESAELEKTLTLSAGRNVIRLVAGNARGGTSEKEISITYNRPRIEAPARWVLLVSAERTERSGKRFSALLKKLVRHPEGGFARERVMEVCGASATRRNILAAIRLFLRRAGKKDEVFIFYAGNGISLGSAPEMNFLTCAGTNVRDLEKTAVSLVALGDALRFHLICPNVCGIYFLGDTGSGENRIEHGLIGGTLGGAPSSTVLAASPKTSGDESAEGKWLKLLFSALGSEADGDRNAVITLDEFFSHLRAGKDFDIDVTRFGWRNAKLLVLQEDLKR